MAGMRDAWMGEKGDGRTEMGGCVVVGGGGGYVWVQMCVCVWGCVCVCVCARAQRKTTSLQRSEPETPINAQFHFMAVFNTSYIHYRMHVQEHDSHMTLM